MEENFIDVGGKKIWYGVCGRTMPGVPLLVVHGGPGGFSMPEVVRDFADERPVYFYDQLGCGRSDRAGELDDYSVDYYVGELEAVIAALGFRQVILVGFSWGCALIAAWVLARKPAAARALVLSGPLLSTPRWEADQRNYIDALPAELRAAILDGESRRDYGEAYQAAMMAFYRRHLCRMDPWPDVLVEALGKLNPDVYHTMWGPSEFTVTGKLKHFDLSSRLGEIDLPVLLTCGDRDEAGVATVKTFQEALPRADLAVIPGAAHFHCVEQPEIYKAAVAPFLRTHGRR
jgi:proline iminopeptidase